MSDHHVTVTHTAVVVVQGGFKKVGRTNWIGSTTLEIQFWFTFPPVNCNFVTMNCVNMNCLVI